MESSIEIEKESNGAVHTGVHPWIAAGYGTRSEWRKAKAAANGKTKKAPAKKPAKKVKVQAKSGKKPKKTVKKVAKRVDMEATKLAKRRLAKRTKPTDREARVLAAFGGVGKKADLKTLGDKAFARERPAAKRNWWARNQVRWLVASKHIKKVARGTYVRLK